MRTFECAVCKQVAPKEAHNRICELDVCDGCRLGDLPERVRARGWNLTVSHKAASGGGASNQQFFAIGVVGRLPRDLYMEFRCVPENFTHRLVKMFAEELQVGDELFDDNVYVKTKDRDAIRSFFERSGVQSALVELIQMRAAAGAAEVQLRDSCLEVYVSHEQIDAIQEAQLLTCVLLHHLEEYQVQESNGVGPYR